MKPQIKPCYTCGFDELHRPLTENQEEVIEGEIDKELFKKLRGTLLMCTAEGCRYVRTGASKRPFTSVKRIPLNVQ